MRKPQLNALPLFALLCVSLTLALAEDVTHTAISDAPSNATNYNCPADCHCVLAQHTHTPLLHAKCTSIADLRTDTPLSSTLPIHSIDLSYLSLPRLSHALEKLRDLTSVDLSHNELHEVGHLGRRIKTLNLRHNRLTSAKLGKLPPHVQTLNLQHNDITYLPLELTRLTQLRSLELSHNTINCTCETLEVRNWLQERQVFMEHAVQCAYPAAQQGKSWLQVKQADICAQEKRGWYDDVDAENDLMLGDQPVEGSGEHEEEGEELGQTYMPLNDKLKKPVKSNAHLLMDEVEGSGDLSDKQVHMELSSTMEPEHKTQAVAQAEEEDVEGSGSGGGILFIAPVHLSTEQEDDEEDNDDTNDGQPLEEPIRKQSADIFGNGLGIFDEPAKPAEEEEPIKPVVFHDNHGVTESATDDVDTGTDDDISTGPEVVHAEVGTKDDSNATYFLLGVIVLIVFGLIFYVGIKRCKAQRNAAHDPENPRATELVDMDKKSALGKPLHRNGNETAPLIGDKSKADMAKPINGAGKKPYDGNDIKDGPATQQPLLNGNGTNGTTAAPLPTIEEPEPEPTAHEYYPITPRYPPPKSPRASKYAQYPQDGAEPNNNNNDDVFLPSSPKSGRYSPVYSPETGRVKIKLTETPRPKTPMLVTRSTSNAGDIITTPVRGGNQMQMPPAVHTSATNGHIEH